jgi:hypothetical protein
MVNLLLTNWLLWHRLYFRIEEFNVAGSCYRWKVPHSSVQLWITVTSVQLSCSLLKVDRQLSRLACVSQPPSCAFLEETFVTNFVESFNEIMEDYLQMRELCCRNRDHRWSVHFTYIFRGVFASSHLPPSSPVVVKISSILNEVYIWGKIFKYLNFKIRVQ